jgi:hypothetical protein
MKIIAKIKEIKKNMKKPTSRHLPFLEFASLTYILPPLCVSFLQQLQL